MRSTRGPHRHQVNGQRLSFLRRARRRTLMNLLTRAALAAILLAGCSAPGEKEEVEGRADPIVGGVPTPACAWPTTVSFSQGNAGCTATLIHPKMITIADHCLEGTGGR